MPRDVRVDLDAVLVAVIEGEVDVTEIREGVLGNVFLAQCF